MNNTIIPTNDGKDFEVLKDDAENKQEPEDKSKSEESEQS